MSITSAAVAAWVETAATVLMVCLIRPMVLVTHAPRIPNVLAGSVLIPLPVPSTVAPPAIADAPLATTAPSCVKQPESPEVSLLSSFAASAARSPPVDSSAASSIMSSPTSPFTLCGAMRNTGGAMSVKVRSIASAVARGRDFMAF